jgi:chitin disaccharide deacetylase
MLIINADDYGRSVAETDVALRCFQEGRITSATAMVFMADSNRAADLAKGTNFDLGLHLNLSQPFTGEVKDELLGEYHDRVVRFITSSKYSQCFYHPALRQQFRYVFRAQYEEFVRLYGCRPSHIDGHHHTHLCTNMLLDGIIPAEERVRRSFSFRPGEKDLLNRAYRCVVDWSLARRYRLTDFFFSLQQSLQNNRLSRVFDLSKTKVVELMTHPVNATEYAYLMSEPCHSALHQLEIGSYAAL